MGEMAAIVAGAQSLSVTAVSPASRRSMLSWSDPGSDRRSSTSSATAAQTATLCDNNCALILIQHHASTQSLHHHQGLVALQQNKGSMYDSTPFALQLGHWPVAMARQSQLLSAKNKPLRSSQRLEELVNKNSGMQST